MLPPLQLRFDALETRRTHLIAELVALAPAQIAFHPAPGAWSLPDVAQHLSLVDARTTRVLTERRVTGIPRRTLGDVFYRAPKLGFYFGAHFIRAKMPVKGVAPDPPQPLADTAAKWEATRASLAAYLAEIDDARARAIVYRHPVGGFMDIFDTLRFLTRHHDHHLRQTVRIRRAPGFPVTGPRGA